jgi:hypothetical protein
MATLSWCVGLDVSPGLGPQAFLLPKGKKKPCHNRMFATELPETAL